jgi:hypothetical protein
MKKLAQEKFGVGRCFVTRGVDVVTLFVGRNSGLYGEREVELEGGLGS